MSQLRNTTLGDVQDYETGNAAMRNIDPDCNLLTTDSFVNTKYYLEDDINEVITRNNISDEEFSLMHLNIRSLPKNISKLGDFLSLIDNRFSVIGLSETWLHNDNLDLYELPEYKSIHLTRPSKKGGGVSLYVRKSLECTELPEMSVITEYLECVFIEIKTRSKTCNNKTTVGVVYRPPNTNITAFTEHVINIIQTLKVDNKQCYIMGDFNINLLNYGSHTETQDYIDAMFQQAFIPLISKPTRITATTATVIDNIYSNDLIGANYQLHGIIYTDISDHLPIFLLTKHTDSTKVEMTIATRLYNAQTTATFKESIDKICWDDVYACRDPQECYSVFINEILVAYNNSFPLANTTIRKRKHKPWITMGLRHSIRTKNKLYMYYLKKPTVFNETNYKRYRNKINCLITVAEREYYRHELQQHKGNLKKTWIVLKSIIGRKEAFLSNDKLLIDGKLTKNKKCIADTFNEYFTSIGPELADKIPVMSERPDDYLQGVYKNSMYLSPTTPDEIKGIIKNFKNSSPGWDGIKPIIVKQAFSNLLDPLSYIVNLSFDQGYVPDQLKIADIVPVFKNGDTSLINNYRPISVLPVFSKVFERLMYNRLMNYIMKHNILSNSQFGFRKGYSTDMAISLLIDKISKAIDTKEHVIGLFLDLAKAFDTVNHNILLRKLTHYGIRGNILQWIRNFLSNRQQRVKFYGTKSSLKNITCGVPQGSILGPLLFLIYINDLSTLSDTTFTIMFADDTSIFIQGNNIDEMENVLNSEIKKLSLWLNINKLSLNIQKTHTVTFSNTISIRERCNNICIDGIQINTVHEIKFLGLLINNTLNWSTHIKYISNKISKNIGIIKKVTNKLDNKSLLNLYYMFIYPYITYCNVVWGRAPNIYLAKIHLLQKRVLRVISHVGFIDHTQPLFTSYQIMNIYDVNKYLCCILMYKHNRGMLPDIYHDVFVLQISTHKYNTRQEVTYKIPFCKTNCRQLSLAYVGPKIWNTFITNNYLQYCTSIHMFKQRTKRLILANIC